MHGHADMPDQENMHELKALELQSCEEALEDNVMLLMKREGSMENTSFRIAKFILTPF